MDVSNIASMSLVELSKKVQKFIKLSQEYPDTHEWYLALSPYQIELDKRSKFKITERVQIREGSCLNQIYPTKIGHVKEYYFTEKGHFEYLVALEEFSTHPIFITVTESDLDLIK